MSATTAHGQPFIAHQGEVRSGPNTRDVQLIQTHSSPQQLSVQGTWTLRHPGPRKALIPIPDAIAANGNYLVPNVSHHILVQQGPVCPFQLRTTDSMQTSFLIMQISLSALSLSQKSLESQEHRFGSIFSCAGSVCRASPSLSIVATRK